jgi:hypothetical protein
MVAMATFCGTRIRYIPASSSTSSTAISPVALRREEIRLVTAFMEW